MNRSAIKKMSPWLIRFSHLLFTLSLIPLLLTGLRIAAANEPALIRISMLLPQGDVHSWHFRFAFVFAAACLLYLLGRFARQRLPRVRHPGRLTTLFQLSHYLGWALLTSSLTTGLLLFTAFSLWPVEWVLRVHLVSALGFVLYLVVHASLAFSALPWRRVLSVFWLSRPGRHYWLLIPVLVTAGSWALVLVLSQPDILSVTATDANIELDGEAREPAWQTTPAVTVQTYQGYAQPARGTPVTVQALHDQEHVYFLVSWPDTTRSQVHLPLIKTEEGWRVLQTGAGRADENELYEDKLAIMFSASGEMAGAGTVQLGHKPKTDQPAPLNRRGLHYTTDGRITDVWHWKSVRTGQSLQQVDDNFFGPPTPSDSEYKRYTGGYQKDQDDCEHLLRWNGSDYQTRPECGGFVMNWELYRDDTIVPVRLPRHPDLLKRLGQIDTDPATSDFGSWWLPWDDTIAYHPDDDHYPTGTIMPSVLSLGPFTQGRGDVSAVGYWRDGTWQLELKRKLRTDSDYDLSIRSGLYFWVSTFDHSQTRHSYHLRPLQLRLD